MSGFGSLAVPKIVCVLQYKLLWKALVGFLQNLSEQDYPVGAIFNEDDFYNRINKAKYNRVQ
eukprot:995977-Rhodomonas_salina.1